MILCLCITLCNHYIIQGCLLVDVRDESPANNLAELVPVFAVLVSAVLLVSQLSMDQQRGGEDEVEVWDDMSQSAGKTPRQSHYEVADVVRMTADSPPAGYDQLCPSLRGHRFEVAHSGVVGITSKCILLRVGPPEDYITDEVECYDTKQSGVG